MFTFSGFREHLFFEMIGTAVLKTLSEGELSNDMW